MIMINNASSPSSLSINSTSTPILTTESILSTIDQHASSTALILLPGIQYYTGQYFDIPTITAHAHSKGINIGWDLAHAVGNVELKLHDWDVDFAVWCNYKYINAGPGTIGGLFVHERHGRIDAAEDGAGFKGGYRPRLTGWWGGDKSIRFRMDNSMLELLDPFRIFITGFSNLWTKQTEFVPIPGAQGFQLSNPSIIDLTALYSSLSIFNRATMHALRMKSIRLTAYLEHLLYIDSQPSAPSSSNLDDHPAGFTIITPSDPSSRGAQLSIKLSPGLLGNVMKHLEEKGVVVDERKPDVVRVAPAPLYNSFEDVWVFARVFREAIERARIKREEEGAGEGDGDGDGKGGVMVDGGREEKGWAGIK